MNIYKFISSNSTLEEKNRKLKTEMNEITTHTNKEIDVEDVR